MRRKVRNLDRNRFYIELIMIGIAEKDFQLNGSKTIGNQSGGK